MRTCVRKLASVERIDELAVAVQRYCEPAGAEQPTDRVAEELKRLRHLCDRLELEFAKNAANLAATDFFDQEGSSSTVDWIRHNCKMSATNAGNAITVGEQIPVLQESTSALVDGQIGFQHLALMGRTAEAIRMWGSREFDERPLLDLALQHSVGRFRYDCAHARHAGAPELFLKEHLDAHHARSLELKPSDDGTLFVDGVFDSVAAATIRSALEPLARRLGRDDARTRRERLADALVELANHGLDSAVATRSGKQRAHVQVTVALETLEGRRGAPAAEIEYSMPVPAAAAQRLACDAGIRRIVLDSESAVVDVGRARRVPAAAARRALEVRDGGCVWPGCERPVSWTAAHHVVHWAHNGATDLSNLVLLCYRHHWLLHEGGWQLARTDEGVITIPPLRYRGRPPDARGSEESQPRAREPVPATA